MLKNRAVRAMHLLRPRVLAACLAVWLVACWCGVAGAPASAGLAANPDRPQTPVAAFPYRTHEVAVPVLPAEAEAPGAGADAAAPEPTHVLAGTLVLPDEAAFGPGPYAAAVFVTGSGPQDRDETLFDHRPFLVLADALARVGIASIRCDDRGVGGSTGDFNNATTSDFAHDARAQAAFLRSRPEIDPERVGIIGHSEGGIVAPMVAAEDDRIAFIVSLAGVAVPGRELMIRQNQLIFAASAPERHDEVATAAGGLFDAIIDPSTPQDTLIARTTELMLVQFRLQGLTPDAERVRAMAGPMAAQLSTPWMRWFLACDPREFIAKVRCPALFLNGTLDTQVEASQNLPAASKALGAAGNLDVTVRALPGLNHLFQPASTGHPMEYAGITTTIDESALAVITAWLRERFGPPAGGAHPAPSPTPEGVTTAP